MNNLNWILRNVLISRKQGCKFTWVTTAAITLVIPAMRGHHTIKNTYATDAMIKWFMAYLSPFLKNVFSSCIHFYQNYYIRNKNNHLLLFSKNISQFIIPFHAFGFISSFNNLFGINNLKTIFRLGW